MDYSKISEVYERLESTTKGLEKTSILAKFLGQIRTEPEYIYLLQGRIFPDYASRELGISRQLAIRAISRALGIRDSEVVEEFKKLGDLGKAVEHLIEEKKKQTSLFKSKLSIRKVLDNLRKLPRIEGKGTVDTKIGIVVELLHSASPIEAKYIIRTVLGDLKIGIGAWNYWNITFLLCFRI